MANKRDVFNAFYEGVCACLMSGNVLSGINLNEAEFDVDELREFLDANPDLYPNVRQALDLAPSEN